jgi:hypothetical protein
LSLLLILSLASRVFLRVLLFSSLRKNQHFKIPIGFSGRIATLWNHWKFLFIYFILFMFEHHLAVTLNTLKCFRKMQRRLAINLCVLAIRLWIVQTQATTSKLALICVLVWTGLYSSFWKPQLTYLVHEISLQAIHLHTSYQVIINLTNYLTGEYIQDTIQQLPVKHDRVCRGISETFFSAIQVIK